MANRRNNNQQRSHQLPYRNNGNQNPGSIPPPVPGLEMTMPHAQMIMSINQVKGQPLDKREHWKNQASQFPEQEKMSPVRATRPGFGSGVEGAVFTNYIPLELDAKQKLAVYHVENMPEAVSSRKRRMLMEALMEKDDVFRKNRESLATDFKHKIITWVNLKDVKLATPVEDTRPQLLREVSLDNYDARKPTIPNQAQSQGAAPQIKLKIHFQRVVSVAELQAYYSGNRTGCHFADNELLAALNIIIGNEIQSRARGAAFELGTNRLFAKSGHASLNVDEKTAIRGYSFGFRAGMGMALLNVSPITSIFHIPMRVSEFLKYNDSKAKRNQLVGVRVYLLMDRGQAMGKPELDNVKRRVKTIAGFSDERAGYQKAYYDENDQCDYTVWQHMEWYYGNSSNGTGTAGHRNSVVVNLGGEKGHEQWFLAEDLWILPYQIYRGDLTPEMTSSLIQKACRSPEVNRNAIVSEFLPWLGLNNGNLGNQLQLKALNMKISPSLLTLPATYAGAVQVEYGGEAQTSTRDGKWDLTDQKFLSTTGTVKGKVCFMRLPTSPADKADQAKYMRFFFQEVTRNGIRLPMFPGFTPQNSIDVTDFSVQWLKEKIEVAKKNGFSLVILILPKKNKTQQHNYANFKAAADQHAGLVSLCICDDKAKRCFWYSKGGERRAFHGIPDSISPDHAFSGYARNIGMKLNLRLGNKNHSVPTTELEKYIPKYEQDKDLMILGADVIHPGLDPVEGTPSIAAVVGSLDAQFAAFRGSARRQKPKEKKESLEVIEAMKEMATERIQAWKAANGGNVPGRVLYYRDGIDEGQFQAVQINEVAAIRSAWESVAGAKPGSSSTKELKITAIVVTKRHNTRFYPKDSKHQIKNGNCEPGTIVDSGVTLPYYFDFFLISRNALQGTARPAHYIVLRDEISFTADQIQKLTNLLCYTYARSTTAVSYVPAAYYADRLCERVKLYLRSIYEQRARRGDGGSDVESGRQRFRKSLASRPGRYHVLDVMSAGGLIGIGDEV